MIEFDHEPGGLVRLAFLDPPAADDEERYLAALNGVARIDGPFVMVAVLASGQRLSRDGKRRQALWYKASRQRLETECRGMAIVRPNAEGEMQATFARLWIFPVLVTASETEAREWLRPLMESGAGGQ